MIHSTAANFSGTVAGPTWTPACQGRPRRIPDHRHRGEARTGSRARCAAPRMPTAHRRTGEYPIRRPHAHGCPARGRTGPAPGTDRSRGWPRHRTAGPPCPPGSSRPRRRRRVTSGARSFAPDCATAGSPPRIGGPDPGLDGAVPEPSGAWRGGAPGRSTRSWWSRARRRQRGEDPGPFVVAELSLDEPDVQQLRDEVLRTILPVDCDLVEHQIVNTLVGLPEVEVGVRDHRPDPFGQGAEPGDGPTGEGRTPDHGGRCAPRRSGSPSRIRPVDPSAPERAVRGSDGRRPRSRVRHGPGRRGRSRSRPRRADTRGRATVVRRRPLQSSGASVSSNADSSGPSARRVMNSVGVPGKWLVIRPVYPTR